MQALLYGEPSARQRGDILSQFLLFHLAFLDTYLITIILTTCFERISPMSERTTVLPAGRWACGWQMIVRQ